MRLDELLAECARTFVGYAAASMKRNGVDPKQMAEMLESTEELLAEYNDHVLRTFAGSAMVVPVRADGSGSPQA